MYLCRAGCRGLWDMFWIYTSRPDCEREPGPGGTGRYPCRRLRRPQQRASVPASKNLFLSSAPAASTDRADPTFLLGGLHRARQAVKAFLGGAVSFIGSARIL